MEISHFLRKQYQELLNYLECACGQFKSRGDVLCERCWKSLPWKIQEALYPRDPNDLAVAYPKALDFLRAKLGIAMDRGIVIRDMSE
jgi:hypothetical protein